MQAYQGRLEQALKRNRLQQKHVADALGVSRMTVLSWVHERSVPTGTNLLRLIEFLRQFEPTLAAEEIFPSEPIIDPATNGARDAYTQPVTEESNSPAESKR